MMKHKLLIPIFVLIFSVLSGSLGTESQVSDDVLRERIDKKLSKFNAELIYLEGQWKDCDNLWGALDRLREEENGNFFKSLDVESLCTQHEKVIWGMIGLKEKICELESRKSALIN